MKRLQGFLRLSPIASLQFDQRSEKALDVFLVAGVHNIEVKRGDWRAIQDGADAADHDEIDRVPGQRAKNGDEISGWHCARGSRGAS